MAAIPCTHMNHVNFVVEDYQPAVERMKDLFGAHYAVDLPRDHWESGLLTVSDAIIEFYSPRETFFLTARYGPHYVGAEYEVPDVVEARRIVGERGIRIVRELGMAFHTHPADTFGIAMELYNKNFHATNPEWFLPAEHWRTEQPIGFSGISRLTAAVHDLDAAVAMFTELFGGVPEYEATRAGGTAKAVGLRFGDGVLEFMTPTSGGAVESHLHRYGDGLRSTVFSVADLAKARDYFTGRGVSLVDADDEGGFAVDPSETAGFRVEIVG